MPKNPSSPPAGPQDRTTQESEAPGAAAQADGGAPQAVPARAGRAVSERKKQFLVAARQPLSALQAAAMAPMGLPPLQLAAVEQALRASPDVEVLDKIGPKPGLAGMQADGGAPFQGVLVARMSEQRAAALLQQGQGWLLVERDHHLRLFDPVLRQPDMVTSVVPSSGPALQALVLVLGTNGAPLADAEVSLFGSMLPATAITDADGQATLTLYGESPHTVSGLYVKPKSDYWSFYQRDPDISVDEPNVVTLRALSEWPALDGFPARSAHGWGQRAMRLDQLPPTFRGQGVRIAVIDSGAATTHHNLNTIRAGFDIINKNTSPDTWNEDALGHGSHCAGVIAGTDPTFGIRGFAPDAEIHVCKLFPGGQVSHLIEALEYCIEHQVDVVNLSLGGAEPSEALEQQIQRARRAGVACIAAAGNTGGPVQYPASSPNVLAVAAIGKLDEFPADSYHAETLGANATVDQQGHYAARFSSFGAQVDVCGPGVAIVSSVPPNNFAAWDGTSMAAPHVTGLAALILAHHPEFQSTARARNADRVERLFQIIKLSARRIGSGDPARFGSGLPDAVAALAWPMMRGVPLGHQPGAPQPMFASLLGSAALGGMGGALDPGLAAWAAMGAPQQPQRQFGVAPFGIGPGMLGPGGW